MTSITQCFMTSRASLPSQPCTKTPRHSACLGRIFGMSLLMMLVSVDLIHGLAMNEILSSRNNASSRGTQNSWMHPNRQVSQDLNAVKPHQRIRFMAPLLEYGYPPAVNEYETGQLERKPLLLYLPGFDGTFLSPFVQFPELHTIFDVRCLTVAVEDRSTVEDLKESVLAFIQKSVLVVEHYGEANHDPPSSNAKTSGNHARQKRIQKWPNRKSRLFYLAGESFGGILASEVALELRKDKFLSFGGLCLINPATCYYRSRLATEGPMVAASSPWLYYFNLMRLLPLFTDKYSVEQLFMILRAEAMPSVIDDAVREAYFGRVAFSLPFVLPMMKQETLQWRLTEWLERGSARLENKLDQLADESSLRILLVVGEHDATLPSIDEAERLAGIFGPKQLKIHVVEGAGHASTCGSRVDLAALFRQTFPRLCRQSSVKERMERSGARWPLWRRGTEERKEPARPPRTAMKPVAAQGKGKYLGMEPRYDNATVGLSPLLYWDKSYYKKLANNSNTHSKNCNDLMKEK